eukprot:7328905-Karenia_brevis.AAC.1
MDGFTRKICPYAFQLSVVFAPACRFMRYFAQHDIEDEDRRHGLAAEVHAQGAEVNKSSVSRKNCDSIEDDETHTWFDPVFSEVLPGEVLVIGTASRSDGWKRVQN